MARKITNHLSESVDADADAIDLTPMLDVVFILLIFFIVTAAFVREFTLPIATAAAENNNAAATDDADILVDITGTNEIWIDQRRIDQRSVRANFERLHAENPKAFVVVRADGASNVKTYIQVADSAYAAGVESVVIVPVTNGDARR